MKNEIGLAYSYINMLRSDKVLLLYRHAVREMGIDALTDHFYIFKSQYILLKQSPLNEAQIKYTVILAQSRMHECVLFGLSQSYMNSFSAETKIEPKVRYPNLAKTKIRPKLEI